MVEFYTAKINYERICESLPYEFERLAMSAEEIKERLSNCNELKALNESGEEQIAKVISNTMRLEENIASLSLNSITPLSDGYYKVNLEIGEFEGGWRIFSFMINEDDPGDVWVINNDYID